jgi:hypothetical protein
MSDPHSLFSLAEVIAGSGVLMSTGSPDVHSLVIHIGRPVPADVDWQCSHQITGLAGDDHVVTAYGVDALQALWLCIRMASARVEAIEQRLGIRLPDWDSAGIG